jgi:hypothetical protein
MSEVRTGSLPVSELSQAHLDPVQRACCTGVVGALVWLKVALTYLTPLLVSNLSVLSATRRGAFDTAP